MTFSPVAPILSTEELILTNFRRERKDLENVLHIRLTN